ncbi:MAG: sugar ABC transporter ATP-binding protein [Bacteroidota bacterium]
MQADGYILQMKKISKEFFGNQVLKDVDLDVRPGEIVGLVGENGAGKSTLMNILFGNPIIHATGGFTGQILFDGQEVNFANPLAALDKGIGMVHQEFVLIPGFTAMENIQLNKEPLKYSFCSEIFGDRLNLLDREAMKRNAIEAIKLLEVELDPEMLVSEMPVGHRQFTEIAREISRRGIKLLVLDEPTAVLTESEAEIVVAVLRRLAAKGIAVIFISHRLSEIMAVCDRIVILRDGALQKELLPSQTNPREIARYMVGGKLAVQTEKQVRKEDAGDTILSIRDLWVDMPGEPVNGVSLEIQRGEIFGIGGLTGQGKLGIANGVMGLYPAEGAVFFKGNPIPLNNPKAALAQGLAFVSEDRRGIGLLLDLPLSMNIAFTAMQVKKDFIHPSFLGRLFKWRDERAIRELARQYIDLLQIKCVDESQIVRELSGGNQQKVCMAKAFALQPELMFVSEPTRGIDIGAKGLVLETIKRFNQEYGRTIIITSSELEELRSVSDRIAIVSEGRIAGILPASAEPEEFGLLMLGRSVADKEGIG